MKKKPTASPAALQLAFLDYGIAAARAAGIPDDRIINCMPVEALLEWAAHLRYGARTS